MMPMVRNNSILNNHNIKFDSNNVPALLSNIFIIVEMFCILETLKICYCLRRL
jgi:hypothetical protein